jgi:hypothetical protein
LQVEVCLCLNEFFCHIHWCICIIFLVRQCMSKFEMLFLWIMSKGMVYWQPPEEALNNVKEMVWDSIKNWNKLQSSWWAHWSAGFEPHYWKFSIFHWFLVIFYEFLCANQYGPHNEFLCGSATHTHMRKHMWPHKTHFKTLLCVMSA